MRAKAKRTDRSTRGAAFALALVLVSLFAFSQVSGQTATVVRVPALSTVSADRVTLGDVATIEGPPGASERLRLIPLGYAPAVGASREIVRERILMSIRASGFTEREVSLVSPDKIVLSRASQRVAVADIHQAMETAVLRPLKENRVDARFGKLDVPTDLSVPVGEVDLKVSVAGAVNIFAPFSASLEIRVEGTVYKRIPINAEVEAFADVLVASSDIPLNSRITADAVSTERRRIVKPISQYIVMSNPMKGMVSIKNIKAGEELTADMFVSGIVVRTGELVRIVGRSGDLQITVNGIAKASGRIGERIPVANSESKTILHATVADEGVVRVSF